MCVVPISSRYNNLRLRIFFKHPDLFPAETLLERIKSVYSNIESLPPDRIVPTVGLNIDHIEAANRKLVSWDLGGQFEELLPGPHPSAVDNEDGNAEACETREGFMIDEE
ncbi:hypothetical protein AHAS_Ahas05G0104900 [Arachis hypogaea]